MLRVDARIFVTLALLIALPAWQGPAAAGDTAPPPNILVVLADDLGYGDLACYGHPLIRSPNLDRFAREGLRLTDCYAAAANCSPARTGLMTGRTPYRVGIYNWIPIYSPMHVRRDEITIATLLRDAGYATCHVGKWHLNGRFNMPGQPQPSDHGFDHWFSTQNNALPNHHNPDNFVRNGVPAGLLEGYSAQIVVDEAIGWLRDTWGADGGEHPGEPFFLFVCFHEPHEPIATDPRFTKRYPSLNEPTRAAHHGNVTQMDNAFGRLMKAVDELDLRENTFVFFTSDNGPAITRRHPHGSAGPLREKKGHLYDGGIRVPGILRWPGRTPVGGVCDQPVSGVDLLPTLCAVAGIQPPKDRAIDGANFLPILDGQAIVRETPLYWQFNWAPSKPKVAMRSGDWKILAHLTGPDLKPGADLVPEEMQAIKEAELSRFELYNLGSDSGETTDLAPTEPERLERMSAVLRGMYREVRGEGPIWPAWQWPRYEAQRIIWKLAPPPRP